MSSTAEINRVAKGYTKQARIPGFRPGKVPADVVKQRFREQILHDVMHGLIPRAVEEALQERGIEPVDTPEHQGRRARRGTAAHVHGGHRDRAAVRSRRSVDDRRCTRHATDVTDEAVEQTLQQLRERAAQARAGRGRGRRATATRWSLDLERKDADGKPDRHEDVSLELGAPANPPGFDAQLIGLSAGDDEDLHDPLPRGLRRQGAGRHRRRLHGDGEGHPPQGAARARRRVREGPRRVRVARRAARPRARRPAGRRREEHAAQRLRTDLLKQLVRARHASTCRRRSSSARSTGALEEFARQLMQQNVDPRQAGIDWAQFREAQREPARDSVASALVLDEIARREETHGRCRRRR